MTLPSSEPTATRLTVSSVTLLQRWPEDRLIVSSPSGYHFGLSKLKEANPGTKAEADKYHSPSKPLAAAPLCSKTTAPACRAGGSRTRPWLQGELSTSAPRGSPRPPSPLCSGASISNIFAEISSNSCSGSSRRSWLSTHFCLNVGPK